MTFARLKELDPALAQALIDTQVAVAKREPPEGTGKVTDARRLKIGKPLTKAVLDQIVGYEPASMTVFVEFITNKADDDVKSVQLVRDELSE